MNSLVIISEQRKPLMGIAIVLIMLYHSAIVIPIDALEPIVRNGDIGVEMFALLSGLGVFFSLSKNDDTLAYYKRRLARILPSFLLVAVPFGLFSVFHYNASWAHFFSLITGVSTFKGDYTFWFVSFVLVFYLVSPFLFKVVRKTKAKFLISFFSLIICFLVSFIVKKSTDSLMWIPRFAVFPLGMQIGHMVIGEKRTNRTSHIALIASMSFLLLSFAILSVMDIRLLDIRYLVFFVLIVPITFCFASIFDICPPASRLFSLFGGISLELYLVHEHVCIPIARLLSSNQVVVFVIALVMAYIMAWLLSRISKMISSAMIPSVSGGK